MKLMSEETGGPTILLVEDDPELARMVAEYLTENGYRVSVDSRGDTAVNRIVSELPEAVILDVNLPGMDGFSVCRQVRDRYPGTILMLTARSGEVDEVLGLECGADDYLLKPVRPRALLTRLKAHLRRHSPLEQPTTSNRTNILTLIHIVTKKPCPQNWLAKVEYSNGWASIRLKTGFRTLLSNNNDSRIPL